MTGQQPFEYSVLRVVPRVDRGEAMNAGVLLYCRPLRYLKAWIELDTARLLALDPAADVAGISRALAAIVAVCNKFCSSILSLGSGNKDGSGTSVALPASAAPKYPSACNSSIVLAETLAGEAVPLAGDLALNSARSLRSR